MILLHCYKPALSHRRETIAPRKWSPPALWNVLVNVDATLFDDFHLMAAGVVVCDHQGHCVLATSEPLPSFTSPELVEALALWRVVSLAHDHGFVNVIFASDCFSFIQRVSSKAEDRSPAEMWWLISGSKLLLFSQLCPFMFIDRSTVWHIDIPQV
jgi:hypothetical protein